MFGGRCSAGNRRLHFFLYVFFVGNERWRPAMDAIPSQCGQMARVAEEYCQLIDDFEPSSLDREWWTQLERLLPRLHVAVIALVNPRGG